MHAKACTSRTLFHLLWHPRTLSLDSERNTFGRKYAPHNEVDICLHSFPFFRSISVQRDAALLRALHAHLLARGVRICTSNVGFLCDAGSPGILWCNFIGVSSRRIAFVLARDSTENTRCVRRYMHRLQALVAPLLTTKTCLIFFVLCVCTWRSKRRLLLRRVCLCAP